MDTIIDFPFNHPYIALAIGGAYIVAICIGFHYATKGFRDADRIYKELLKSMRR